MAEKESGWTITYPSLAYGSWFWLRHAPDAEPELHQLTGGRNWMASFGIVRNTTEFLGPVTASDAQQLIELRKAIQVEIHRQCAHCKNGLSWTEDGRAHYGYTASMALASSRRSNSNSLQGVIGIVTCTSSPELRAVLNPKHQEKETQ